MESLWHVTLVNHGRWYCWGSADTRRFIVRKILEIVGKHTLLYSLADEHIHLVMKGTMRQIAYTLRSFRASTSLQKFIILDKPHFTQVQNRSHLQNLLKYLLRQPDKHKLPIPAPMWEGSCFVDLIGLRITPSLGVSIFDLLPRLRTEDIFSAINVPVEFLQREHIEVVADNGLMHLVAAVDDLVLLTSSCPARSIQANLGRRLLAQAAKLIGAQNAEIERVVNVKKKFVSRLLKEDEGDLNKVITWASLRAQLADYHR